MLSVSTQGTFTTNCPLLFTWTPYVLLAVVVTVLATTLWTVSLNNLDNPNVEEVAALYVVLLSEPHVAVPSALYLNICPDAPPEGICKFPEVVGWVYTVFVSVELIVIIPAALVNVTLVPAFISIVLAEEPSKVYKFVPPVVPVSNFSDNELFTFDAVDALPEKDVAVTVAGKVTFWEAS